MSTALQTYRSLLSHLYGDDSLAMVKRAVPGDAHGLLYAVDLDSNRHLLLPIDEAYAFKAVLGESLSLSDRVDPDGRRYMDLCCLSDAYREVFAALVDDIVRRLASGRADAPAQIQQALGEWRRLLRPASEMSPEAARGLFGELVVLEWLARRNPLFALDSWTGPDGDCHDFTTPRGNIEVKTSAKEGLDVDISSLRQLDVMGRQALTLIRLSVAETGDGCTMGQMVDRLASSGVPRTPLVQKLFEAGFTVGSSRDTTRFAVTGSAQSWHVTSDFPALRYGELPPTWRDAITKVRYTLDLATAPGRLSEEDLEAILDKVMSN